MRNVKFDPSQVRERREALGYPRWLLAREAGISRQHLANIENGDKTPSLQAAMRLAAALRVHPGKLFADTDEAA